jgi:hypothetical protein
MKANEKQHKQGIDRIHMIYRITAKTRTISYLNLGNPVNPVHSGFDLICVYLRVSAVSFNY